MRTLHITVAALLLNGASAAAQRDSATIVFVCEHGTVKSVVALAHFQKLAAQRGLPLRAISRGTFPDSVLPSFMLAGLRRDGFDFARFNPSRFGESDLNGAIHVVSFDQPDVARRVAGRVPVTAWDGLPSVTADYAGASAAIRKRVAAFVDSIARVRRKSR